MNEIPMLIALALPLIVAVLAGAVGRWPNLRETVSILGGVALFATIFTLTGPVTAGARPSVALFEVFRDIELSFTVEPLGLLFALLASGLWPLTTLYAAGYMRGNDEPGQTRFFVCFAIAIAAAVGIAFAGNLLTLFLFYEILTLSTYPLVTHHGDADSRDGGRVYLGILLSTSIGFFLPAIILTYVLTGTVEFTAGGLFGGSLGALATAALYALFLFGTGKAALMPFHRWLPAAMVAPTPVSALLHAVAVVKAGVFIVLKLTVYVFGIETLSAADAARPMMWVAAVTVILSSLIAIKQDNLKARLAYSTVSQLSYIVLGATLVTSVGIVGGGMHMLMHAFGKITLFFCAGAIYTASHIKFVSDMDGLGRRMPVTMAAFFIGALCVIGIPPTGSFWSKWYLIQGAYTAEQYLIVGVFMVSTLLNVAYLLPPVIRAFVRPAPVDAPAGIHEAPLASVIPLSLTALGCIALFFGIGPVHALLSGLFAN